jgi:hypothetical protein
MMRLPDWLGYEVKEKLYQLNPGKWINDNRRLVTAAACVPMMLLVVTAIVCFWPEKTKRLKPPAKAWFYDLNTGSLFSADKDLIPPIETPSGPLPNGEPAGVKACVLTYADSANQSNRFIGFVEKANRRAQAGGADEEQGGARQWGHARLIRRLEDSEWVEADSPEGRRILEEAFAPDPNGERPHYLRPE